MKVHAFEPANASSFLRSLFVLVFLTCLCAFPSFCALAGSHQDIVNDVSVRYAYPTPYERIADVDFLNLPFHYFNDKGKPDFTVKLKDGWYSVRNREMGFEAVELDAVQYLPSLDADRQYAVVWYTWSIGSGGSPMGGIAQVFELYKHRLAAIQQLEWDKEFDTSKPYISFNEESHTLVIRAAHYLPQDAHCCVSAMDVVTFNWNGSAFVNPGMHPELSDYGIRMGKKLDP